MPPTSPLVFPVANPAAGANFLFTAPEDLVIVSINARLVTSAVVANRIMGFNADDGGANVYWRAEVNFSQVASGTIDYACFAGGGFDGRVLNNVVTCSLLPAPGLTIPAGSRLRSAIAALDVGDQLSQITILAAR